MNCTFVQFIGILKQSDSVLLGLLSTPPLALAAGVTQPFEGVEDARLASNAVSRRLSAKSACSPVFTRVRSS